jgi:hypothetical protein
MFSPETVVGYTNEELERIAGEGDSTILKRKHLRAIYNSLIAGLSDLRR